MAENRGFISSLQDDPACHSLLVDRPPSRLSRVSSTSSRINREEMTNMNDSEIDILCKQVFALCDANGDGFITEDELIAQCGEDDPELFNQLMKTMDTNEDGKISFEEFRSGLDVVTKHLNLMQQHSTPNDKMADNHVTVYEHEPSMNEKEEAWLITMDKIDPAGYISNNTELRSVWIDLLTRDSNLLDKFEVFLMNVVEDLGKSHSDIEHIEKRMKQLLTDHSKQVSEMDGILNEQLREACVQEQVKSKEKSSKLSDQYRDLLAERDELIATLADKEQTLQERLTEKVHNEQELRKERLQLLHLNRSLQDQLSDSYRQLSASQLEIQRLSFHEKLGNNDEDNRGAYPLLDEPIVEMSSDCPVSEDNSLSSQNMITLSPPPDPPTQLSLKSPNLAAEVAEALQQERDDATPTLCHSFSTTPTEDEDDENSKLLSSDEDKEFIIVSNGGGAISLDHSSSSIPSCRPSTIPMTTPTPMTIAGVTIYQVTQPSSTPVNMIYDPTSFTASTIIQPRQEYTTAQPTTALNAQLLPPSRVFKVVFLGDSGVGKTSLIHRLTNGSFISPQSTLGLDYNTCMVSVGEEKVVFQLWDTAGQERFQSTTAVYFKRADAFVIVYDVTNKNTFKSIKTWIALAKATLRCDLPVVMVMGNKTDKEQQRNVTKDEGRQLALDLCAMFSETSALSGDNVVQAHTMLASLLLERENKDIEQIKQSALRLDKLQEKKKCKC